MSRSVFRSFPSLVMKQQNGCPSVADWQTECPPPLLERHFSIKTDENKTFLNIVNCSPGRHSQTFSGICVGKTPKSLILSIQMEFQYRKCSFYEVFRHKMFEVYQKCKMNLVVHQCEKASSDGTRRLAQLLLYLL